MYALFYEDDLILIATVDRESHALALGEVISRQRGRPVVVVWNRGNGDADLCGRFTQGDFIVLPEDDRLAALSRLSAPVARLASYGR